MGIKLIIVIKILKLPAIKMKFSVAENFLFFAMNYPITIFLKVSLNCKNRDAQRKRNIRI
jgi:hypothetical protein